MANLRKFATAIASAALFAGVAWAQQDPGVQSASRGTGQSIIGSDDPNGFSAFFTDGLIRFQEVEGVNNPATGDDGSGLGPRFNFNQCSGCHASPAVGGSSPAVNPQFAAFGSCSSVSALSEQPVTVVAAGQPNAAQHGTIACSNTNTIPAQITANGPVREARFPFFLNSNGSVNTSAPNGGVEDLFVVSDRPDGATGCSAAQPNFAQAASLNNEIFRIPTPLFGGGLIENVDDGTLLANRQANLRNSFGIGGTFNTNGNDGTITRFGWKAQNKSLMIFAGEAYNVEMGITNLLFQTERPLPEEENASGLPSGCINLSTTGYPEDTNNPNPPAPFNSTENAAVQDDVSAFADFARFLAPPPPGGVILNGSPVPASTIAAGAAVFQSIGCATCHNPNLGPTATSNFVPALSGVTFHPYTDLEVHHMGSGFADNVSQGNAGGDQFRTAPLWGLGQRNFFDHDGRDQSVPAAIQNHMSNGSEANTVITNYNNLNSTQKQELIDFLRSL
ncbi:MAG: di-heme oxidoredictase family protein [Terracidiphilus sp.]